MDKKLRPITISNDETGEVYTLTFTRQTVVMAERAGFDISQVSVKPLTTIADLIYYSLLANHGKVQKTKAMEILDWLGGVKELDPAFIERLTDLYSAAYDSLKNDKVTVNF